MLRREIGDGIWTVASCKICCRRHRRVVATRGRHFQDLTTVICSGCGLIHSHPIPNDSELALYYKKQYRAEYKLAFTPQRKHIIRYSRSAMSRLSRLKKHVKPGGLLLDVGSGSGEFLFAAGLAGFEVLGIEPHQGYSSYTRDAFGINVLTSTFQEAQIAEGSVDVITMHHVLEHLPNPLSALIHVAGWLKMGGVLMVDVPDIEHTQHSPVNRFHFAHIFNFNHHTLNAMLVKAGFEIVSDSACKSGTTLAAKKIRVANFELPIVMPDNYERLYANLMQGSSAEQYRSKAPVKRFFLKCYKYPKEVLLGAWLWDPKRIVMREYKMSCGT